MGHLPSLQMLFYSSSPREFELRLTLQRSLLPLSDMRWWDHVFVCVLFPHTVQTVAGRERIWENIWKTEGKKKKKSHKRPAGLLLSSPWQMEMYVISISTHASLLKGHNWCCEFPEDVAHVRRVLTINWCVDDDSWCWLHLRKREDVVIDPFAQEMYHPT